MLVWRIEDKDGIGPYTRNSVLKLLLECNDPVVRPIPSRDGIDIRNIIWKSDYEAFFGFASAEALDRWFPSYMRRALSEDGYVISVYDIEDVYVCEGRRQVIFAKDLAVKVKEYESPTNSVPLPVSTNSLASMQLFDYDIQRNRSNRKKVPLRGEMKCTLT